MSVDNLKHTDQMLGKCLRLYRTLGGMTQTELGNMVGVSFQQIQKYENGSTRISAAQLLNLARALKISVIEFYDRLEEIDYPEDSRPNPKTIEMLTVFQQLPHSVQRNTVELLKSVLKPS